MMLLEQLRLERCPHCRVHRPTLARMTIAARHAFNGSNPRIWSTYKCSSCGGMVLAWGQGTTNTSGAIVLGTLPELSELSDVIPATARRYLYQAQESLHSPDGAVMLAASAVDAMLKAKGYQDGRSLYSRIKAAADDHPSSPPTWRSGRIRCGWRPTTLATPMRRTACNAGRSDIGCGVCSCACEHLVRASVAGNPRLEGSREDTDCGRWKAPEV